MNAGEVYTLFIIFIFIFMIPSVNYFAVLVAAVSAIVLGFLWYGPLFGKPWMKLMGFTKESLEKSKKAGMTKTYVLMVLTTLVTAYVLSHVISFATAFMQTSGISAGLSAGFWMWLGFTVPILMDAQMWEGKPWKLFWINASYRLVSLSLMGAILAGWM